VRFDHACISGPHCALTVVLGNDFYPLPGRGKNRRQAMEPIMCPFCGGTNLFQEDDYSLELDFEYWTIHHWECLDCAQSFDKIEILPASNTFEEINESTIH
jgi:hypothetical protein